MTDPEYDLVIIGGNAAGLSLAISATRGGVTRTRVLEPSSTVVFPELVGENQLDVGYGEAVTSVDTIGETADDGPVLAVTTAQHTYTTRAVVVAERAPLPGWNPPIDVARSDRILVDQLPPNAADQDVLVVGFTDHAVELASALAFEGAGVVLAAGGMDPTRLSPAGENWLRRLERDRRATLLYRSVPEKIDVVDGYPMAYFGDRRTPDLQFDHVVFASARATPDPATFGVSDAALAAGRVWFVGEPTAKDADSDTGEPAGVMVSPGWKIGLDVAEAFPQLTTQQRSGAEVRRRFTSVIDDLREENYNATITAFEPTHSDLWVLRVKPDRGGTSHLPGQYASLGLGYWEARVDDAEDPNLDEKWDKLIRRSYSISSRMFDEHGYLTNAGEEEELEFYIVLVPPTPDNVPGLTPRLALKRPGDRIYLGPKVAGRYTLAPVTDPESTVVFLSTGTGEAPHNAMVVELLRKGHRGPIVSAVSVRKWVDLGYLDKHRALESHYPNYHYLPMPTREPDVPKRYIQKVIEEDGFATEFGVEISADTTHVFMCGNPAMIGLPEEVDGATVYPETTGVVELLAKRGFTLDHRKVRGNLHFEEYW